MGFPDGSRRPAFSVKVWFGINAVLLILEVSTFWVEGATTERWTTLQPEFRGADPPPNIIKRFWSVYKLIPFPLQKDPEQILEVEYLDRIKVKVARYLFPRDLRQQPTRVAWPRQYVNSYYTLIMTDLDYPSEKDKSGSEWLHWLMGNIRGPPDKRQNETIAQYIGPDPGEGTGVHRYIFYLFRQPREIEYSYEPKLTTDRNDPRRARFSTHKFMQKYNLGNPAAATFFLAEFWHYNDTIA